MAVPDEANEAAIDIQEADTHDGEDEIGIEKAKVQQIEAAKYELNKIDFDQISREAIHWKSRAVLRLAAVILVQGISARRPLFPPCP